MTADSSHRAEFIVASPGAFVEVERASNSEIECSSYAFKRGYFTDARYFHRDGVLCRVESAQLKFPQRWWQRLVSIVWSIRLTIIVQLERADDYEITTPKGFVSEAILNDGGIFTQWYEADELLADLDRSTSFDDVVGVLEKAQTPSVIDGNE